jgi:hypothetical protein
MSSLLQSDLVLSNTTATLEKLRMKMWELFLLLTKAGGSRTAPTVIWGNGRFTNRPYGHREIVGRFVNAPSFLQSFLIARASLQNLSPAVLLSSARIVFSQ